VDVEGKRGRGPEAEHFENVSTSSLLGELRNLVHFPILPYEFILLSFCVINESKIRLSYYCNS